MLRAALFSLVASVLAPVLAVQVPLGSGYRWNDKKQAILGNEDLTDWNLDKLPNPNDTDHLVFETVHSLLQHWPNTRMRNGMRSARLFDFNKTHVLLQVITLYRASSRKVHFCTMVREATSFHRVRSGLLQILNIRIFSAGMDSDSMISNKDVGISRSRPLDPSKSYILTEAVLRRC